MNRHRKRSNDKDGTRQKLSRQFIIKKMPEVRERLEARGIVVLGQRPVRLARHWGLVVDVGYPVDGRDQFNENIAGLDVTIKSRLKARPSLLTNSL